MPKKISAKDLEQRRLQIQEYLRLSKMLPCLLSEQCRQEMARLKVIFVKERKRLSTQQWRVGRKKEAPTVYSMEDDHGYPRMGTHASASRDAPAMAMIAQENLITGSVAETEVAAGGPSGQRKRRARGNEDTGSSSNVVVKTEGQHKRRTGEGRGKEGEGEEGQVGRVGVAGKRAAAEGAGQELPGG